MPAEELVKRHACDETHHEIRHGLVRSLVMQLGDAGMVQAAQKDPLAAEPGAEHLELGQPLVCVELLKVLGIGAQELDRDVPVGHQVGGTPDLGHAAFADRLDQPVAPADHLALPQPP